MFPSISCVTCSCICSCTSTVWLLPGRRCQLPDSALATSGTSMCSNTFAKRVHNLSRRSRIVAFSTSGWRWASWHAESWPSKRLIVSRCCCCNCCNDFSPFVQRLSTSSPVFFLAHSLAASRGHVDGLLLLCSRTPLTGDRQCPPWCCTWTVHLAFARHFVGVDSVAHV